MRRTKIKKKLSKIATKSEYESEVTTKTKTAKPSMHDHKTSTFMDYANTNTHRNHIKNIYKIDYKTLYRIQQKEYMFFVLKQIIFEKNTQTIFGIPKTWIISS